MSKRAGTFVTLRDVVDQVGPDVTRFVMLTRKNDAMLDFDFDKVMEQSRENPVFYVQYAHARVASVLRKAQEAGIAVDDATLRAADRAVLDHPSELGLIAKLAEWPRLVETAARTNEPHRVAFYLYELAGVFHALWNKGNEVPSLRFVQDDPKVTQSKIALARATSVVIAAGLGILGVKPAQEMR
jgi:arginyl-tRNA synthetase